MKNHLFSRALAVAMLVFNLPAGADDIELFSGPRSEATAPTVLFVLDNAANFSASVATQRCSITAPSGSSPGVVATNGTGTAPTNLDRTAGAVEQCALYKAIQALETNATDGATLNIGVMGFNATGMKQFNPETNTFSGDCVNGTGGCLLMKLAPFTSTTKANILEWIRLWAISGNSNYVIKGNNTASGAAMQEAWAYLYGKTGVSGRSYSAIAPGGTCSEKNIIFIGNAYRNNSTPGDGTNESSSPLRPLNGTSLDVNKRANPVATADQIKPITGNLLTKCGTGILQTDEGKGIYALNWAKYLKAQKTTTFSIGVLGETCNAEYAAHLTQLGSADVGGGGFFGTSNFEELVAAIGQSLNKIQSINSAFASVSLPVSVSTQGTYLNQVYIGMFRPDAKFLPRWFGNLKQYRMAMVGGVLALVDAADATQTAIDGTSGFIQACARSYWTPVENDAYWGTTFEDANCSTHPASSNTPDGNIVEKGGQAFKLRGLTPSSRVVKTCDASCSSTLATFNSSNAAITKASLGNSSMSDDARTSLIEWARGVNNQGETLVSSTAMRPSVHGDVVHSRPVAINYGTNAAPEVVVFYGGNDGVLRAINGNRDSGLTFNGTAPGNELWAFIAPESYGIFSRLYDNNVSISYKGGTVLGAQPKAYGFDGPIVADKTDSHAWIFASLRRGGRAIYAFDVTDRASPTLKWKRGCTSNFPTSGTVDDTACLDGGVSSPFVGIGQTWATPKVVNASGYSSGASSLLLFGGGYDPCEDYDSTTQNNNCTSSNKGNRIYVVDANTGAFQKALNTERGVVGEIVVVPDATTGLAKYAYAADLGGNVYRINIGSAAPADWTLTKIASLGCDTVATCLKNRKFFFAPDVVEENGIYYLLIGSGDREKPLSLYTGASSVTNYFFMIKDKPADSTWLSSEQSNCSNTSVICKNSLLAISTSATPSQADLDAKKGWYLALSSTEQVVTSAITVFGTVTFSTHKPTTLDANSCSSNLGTSNVYNIRYLNAASANGTELRYQHISGDGLPPSPVAGKVTLDDGSTVPFVIGARPTSGLEAGVTGSGLTMSVNQSKARVYWYIQQ